MVHGFKIFLNIAFDAGVPPPPSSSENDIRKAMSGDEGAYFVPVVVSDGREVTDKGAQSFPQGRYLESDEVPPCLDSWESLFGI